MNRTSRLLWITFAASISTVVVTRGIYFFTKSQLTFSQAENLWLALVFGVVYVVGAMLSHRLTVEFGERRLLMLLVIGHVVGYGAVAIWKTAAMIVIANMVFAFLAGAMWPVMESYVSAGRSAVSAARAIGRFNVTWSAAVPLGVALAGQMLAVEPALFFIVPAGLMAVVLLSVRRLTPQPIHMAVDHPDRPTAEQLVRYRSLATGCRWAMLASYAMLFLLVPSMPEIFIERLGLGGRMATAGASLLDAARWVSFLALATLSGWQGRRDVPAAAVLLMPVGFFMTLLGGDLATVLIGEILYGVAAGVVYHAALHYALVVQNASVSAGGEHESLIGLGFLLGPMAGLIGLYLAGPLGGDLNGMLVAAAPIALLGVMGGLRPILRKR